MTTRLSGMTTPTDLVTDTIQRVYGDATQTALDREAARQIVAALRAAGWASLDEVARLIEAAGGSITVPDHILANDGDRIVERFDTFDGVTFRVRRRAGDSDE